MLPRLLTESSENSYIIFTQSENTI